MARFIPTDHVLLSSTARMLGAGAIEAHADIAEARLSLADATVSGGEVDRITTAVALQVNMQVEKGVDAHVYRDTSRGQRSKSYRRLGELEVNRDALAIVRSILGGARFGALRSRRGINPPGVTRTEYDVRGGA